MHHSIIKSALIAAALLLSASPSVAADKKPEASSATADTTKKSAKDSKPTEKKAAAVAQIKLVDINSAGKKELKTLPGIGDADADKIIAGRPYGSKAHLTTRGIVARDVYENLKRLVIAKQKQAPAAEPDRK